MYTDTPIPRWVSKIVHLPKIHAQYNELNDRRTREHYAMDWSTKDLNELRRSIITVKKAVLELLGPCCDHGLEKVRFHLFNHIVDDLEDFRTSQVVSASQHEYYNSVVK